MFEGLSGTKLLKAAKTAKDEAVRADSKFVKLAKEDFGYRDGDGQWTEEERRLLAKDRRPAIVMNIIKSTVDLVQGMYEDYRVRHYSAPVEPEDGPECEVLDKVATWVIEHGNSEMAKDEARESSTICGRGWAYVDYYPDPKRPGYILIEVGSASPLDVKVDPASRKPDLSDASYVVWGKWMTVEDFKVRFPEHAKHVETVMDAGKMLGIDMAEAVDRDTDYYNLKPDIAEELEDYVTPLDINYYNKEKRTVNVIHLEYWENYKRYYRWVPDEQRFVEFDEAEIEQFEKLYPVLYGIPFSYQTVMDKRVKWLQFVGDKILFNDVSPIPYDGFSLVPCIAFAESSRRSNMHYGIVRPLKDPQKELNKRWSQTINLINKQVQPGVLVEEGAFLDTKQGEESLREVGGVTILSEGGIDKIQERTVPQFPAATVQLQEMSKEITRWISGLNENLFGFTGETYQSSVVFQLRQSQGVTILRSLFRNFKRFDEEVYKRILAIVANEMQPLQIAEILGRNFDYSGVDLNDLQNVQYTVDIEELPGSQTRRVLELGMYIDMLQYGFQVDPQVLISKMNLPESEKQHWIEYIQQQQEAQMQEAQRQYELEMAKIQAKMQADTDKLKVDATTNAAKLQQGEVKAIRRHQIEQERLANERRGQELDFIAKTAKSTETSRPAGTGP